MSHGHHDFSSSISFDTGSSTHHSSSNDYTTSYSLHDSGGSNHHSSSHNDTSSYSTPTYDYHPSHGHHQSSTGSYSSTSDNEHKHHHKDKQCDDTTLVDSMLLSQVLINSQNNSTQKTTSSATPILTKKSEIPEKHGIPARRLSDIYSIKNIPLDTTEIADRKIISAVKEKIVKTNWKVGFFQSSREIYIDQQYTKKVVPRKVGIMWEKIINAESGSASYARAKEQIHQIAAAAELQTRSSEERTQQYTTLKNMTF